MAGVLPHEGMLPVGQLSFWVLLCIFNQWSKAVGMWSKAAAVGNAGRAAARCPRSQPVRRRRIVHMSIACRAQRARPRPLRSFLPRLFHTSAGMTVGLRSLPRIISFARSARQALTRRCNVRSCALPA